MKKLLAIILVLTMAVTIFAACGKTTDTTPDPAVEPETPVAEVTPEPETTTPEATSTGDNTELNLYTWEGVFPQEVLEGFTAETGIKINYSTFDMGETMLAKLEADTAGSYDLVLVDDYIIDMAVSGGLAQPLDKSKLSNFSNINPTYQGQFFDANNEYTVPHGSGVQTIVYNPEVVNFEITGYEDLWNPELADTLGIIGNYRVINGMALKVMGESYNTEDIAKIEEAGAKLKELAPNIRVIKDDNLQNDIITGEIGAGIMYTSQVTMAMVANPNLKVVFPKEGVGFGVMAQFIPKNAQNVDAAHQFMDYLLRADVSAKAFEHFGYYCTNLAAEEFIAEEYKAFLTLPSDLDTSNMEMIQLIGPEAEEAHSRAWTEVVATI